MTKLGLEWSALNAVRRPDYVNKRASSARSSPQFDAGAIAAFHLQLPQYAPTRIIQDLSLAADELRVDSVILKDEASRFGLPSFKILGASWGSYRAVAAKVGAEVSIGLDDLSQKARQNRTKIFAATDGNHGRAVAYMAKLMGVEGSIFVPSTLDEYTRQLIAGEGANVVAIDGNYDETVKTAAREAESTPGAILVQDTSWPGYEEVPRWIVEGYSTMFKEIDDQLDGLAGARTIVICPVGVGSLAHAVVQYFKESSRRVCPMIVTVEPNTAACLNTSLHIGKSATIQTTHTISTGMDCGTVAHTAWPDLRDLVDMSVTVSDWESHCAVQYLAAQGVRAGPCGGSGVAAARHIAHKYHDELDLAHTRFIIINTEGPRPYTIPERPSGYDSSF